MRGFPHRLTSGRASVQRQHIGSIRRGIYCASEVYMYGERATSLFVVEKTHERQGATASEGCGGGGGGEGGGGGIGGVAEYSSRHKFPNVTIDIIIVAAVNG
jgi:hypothetical protein